jgi:nucleoside-diphosphate-sugar epimerase
MTPPEGIDHAIAIERTRASRPAGMRRALVTGAAGFVGSHLTERLLGMGVGVVGVDAFTDFYDASAKRHNIAVAGASERFTLVEADLASADIEPLLASVDTVFHLAAQPGVRGSWGTGFQTYVQDNIVATQRLLEAMAGRGIPLIYSSSSSVYGDALQRPTPEDALPLPVSPYGATKLAGENLCRIYAREGRVPTVSLRYFTVYGPRQRPDMAFSRFISAVADGRPVTLYGDGSQSRDFTFVADAVEANLLAAANGRPGGVYNVGGGEEASIMETLDMIRDLVGRQPIIDRRASAPGDARHTSADVTRAADELGFRPRSGLREGLSLQVEHHLAQYAVAARG